MTKYKRPPLIAQQTSGRNKDLLTCHLRCKRCRLTKDRACFPPNDHLDIQSTKTKVPVFLEAENETTKDNPPSSPPRSHKCLWIKGKQMVSTLHLIQQQ